MSYLPRARVLGWTLKRHHPDWVVTACISDREPEGFEFDIESEPFDRVTWIEDLALDGLRRWLFKHELVEMCTAVKGLILDLLTGTDAKKIFYFDPDIAVMGSLQPMVEMLENDSILLTPHLVEPEVNPIAMFENEVSTLRYGTYNLGFIGVRNDERGRRFSTWWKDRLWDFCYDDQNTGLFVDQKWCDMVPALFDAVRVVRDPGYNVASWNINQRKVKIENDGKILVNGQLLRFFHFTKFGNIGDTMIMKYAGDNLGVHEIYSWYKRMLDKYTEPAVPKGWWHYGHFANGVTIPKHARELYRHRSDLEKRFPDPFSADSHSYYSWLEAEGHLS